MLTRRRRVYHWFLDVRVPRCSGSVSVQRDFSRALGRFVVVRNGTRSRPWRVSGLLPGLAYPGVAYPGVAYPCVLGAQDWGREEVRIKS
jgi:hypothetical protein